jgi:catalase
LIRNLVGALALCPKDIQDRMLANFTKADVEYGRRVADGTAMAMKETATKAAAKKESTTGGNGSKAKPSMAKA